MSWGWALSLGAFVAAGVGSAVLLFVVSGGDPVALVYALVALPYALILTALHTVVLGIPAHFLLTRIWPVRWWNAALAGAVIGTLPVLILLLANGASGDPDFAISLLPFAAGGFAGGLAYRWVLGPDTCAGNKG